MTKNKAALLWVALFLVVLWLLWRNRSKVAPTVFNVPPPLYTDINYPQIELQIPTIQAPISQTSCGCNPAASQYLSGVADKINESQDLIEQQLKQYTDSINNYLQTNTYS